MKFKKSFKVFKENFFILFGIEIIFFLLIFFLFSFLIKKIIFYFTIINSLMPELNNMREFLNQNVNVDIVRFNELIGIIGENLTNMFLIIGIFLLIFYLLYCIFQSTSFRLSYMAVKEKLKLKKFLRYFSWRYFLRFFLFSLMGFVLILPLLFRIIINLKGFIVNSLVFSLNLDESLLSMGSIKELIVLILILLFLIYFIILVYILLNENTILKSIKKAFLIIFKKFYLFFIFSSFLVVSFVLFFLIRVNLFLGIGLILVFFVYFKILMTISVEE